MSALLKFQDVSYWYSRDQKKVEILKKINIDFEKGTFYTITGPSGAGKSTFLALAGALDSPKEGSILYEGKDLKKNRLFQISQSIRLNRLSIIQPASLYDSIAKRRCGNGNNEIL